MKIEKQPGISPRLGRAGAASIAGIAVLTFSIFAQQPSTPAPASSSKLDYNWDVRPILADNCFRCHGPDARGRMAGLRLDQADGAYAKAVVPGKPEDSELIKRITSANPARRMPLGGKTMTAADVATLTEWIRQGAEYKPHWAFIAPVKATPPQPESGDRIVNEIDRFVAARIRQMGIKQSPEADRETLINRASLTLTGLPPTLAEVDAFVKDSSPNAYEKLVDRLLASPAYGEHQASYWLDAARFSESDGFLDDHHDRLLWPWRDWVISAFNSNMRFDQFTTWQLAGDLLPNRTKDQLLATTFLRVGKRTTENGAIHEEYRIEAVLDKTETVGKVFLGLTVGCARCHDHKYDPIRQSDYYSLSGFFNSADEPGYYAPGHSGIQGGPTMLWTDPATDTQISTANEAIQKQQRMYAGIRQLVEREAAQRVKPVLAQPSAQVAKLLDASLQNSLAAYYSFDKTVPFSKDLLPPVRQRNTPPPQLVSLKRAGRGAGNAGGANAGGANAATGNEAGNATVTPGAPPANAQAPQTGLPNGMKPELSVLIPNEAKEGNYGVIENASLKPGPKGNALYFDDTDRGFLGRDVGWYERTQPFTLDLWMLAPKKYEDEDATVINHLDDENSGAAGYTLDVTGDRLRFRIQHSWPWNMVGIIAKQPIPIGQWLHVSVTYDGSSRAGGLHMYWNGKPVELDVERDNLTRSALPMSYSSLLEQYTGVMFGKRFRKTALVGGGIDEVRFYNRDLTPLEVGYLHDPAAVLKENQNDLRKELVDFTVATDPRVITAANQLGEARETENKIVSLVPEVMVMGETPVVRTTYRLNRGVYNQKAEPVPVQGLTLVFPYSKDLPPNRIGLAKWLLDDKNPLTARVFVNRVWQMHFGRGLVDTPQDFGMQGSKPANPQLLDWLAVQFRESGWDIKALNKLIVMSATYRQTSDASDELIAKDPENKLLARGVRVRMTAEMVRDKALAVSGLLVSKVGGPSVYPYQPEGIWEGIGSFYPYPKPNEIPAEQQHRRTLYTFVKRNAPHPEMAVFDFVDRNTSAVNRNVSNSPLQALALLDDPQFVEAYRVLAANVMKASSGRDAQLREIYRLAARRTPDEGQMAVLRDVYNVTAQEYGQARDRAQALVKVGVTPVDASLDVVQLAALTNVTAVAMNTPDAYSVR
jgi:mono/diheme cytochrome c family protein